MRADDPNLPHLRRIAEALGELREQVVFVGGAVAGLLVTDPLADSVRATRDVDAVVNADWLSFSRIEEQVERRGFARDASSDVICRWVHKPLDDEMAKAPTDLKEAVGTAFAQLLAHADFANVLPGLIAEAERAGLLLERLKNSSR